MYNPISLNDVIDQFRAAMLEKDIDVDGPIDADGKLHRVHVHGDAHGSKNGFYILHYDDRPAGQFGCNKRYGFETKFSWQLNKKIDLSPAELQAYRDRVAKERAEKAEIEKARLAVAASRANAMWEAAVPAPDDHPYLLSKGVKAHGIRMGKWECINEQSGEVWFSKDGALLIPIMDRSRVIHSMQAIFPSKLASLGNRNKDYLSGGAKRGLFHTIGTAPLSHDGLPVYALCEGYATGASIHECTGHLTLVCFDAGNLPVVAQAIRDGLALRGKKAIILVCADNDRWTMTPVENPGVHHATTAVNTVGDCGRLAVPDFTDLSGSPTDFNDLHQREGVEVVRAMLESALILPEPDPVVEPEPEPEFIPEPEYKPLPIPEIPPPAAYDASADIAHERNGYFTVLGYDGGSYYVFHHDKGQVMEVSKSDLTDTGMIELAPVEWWESEFPSEKGINKKQAVNWFFRLANSRGIYDPTRIRGRGAWKDKDRHVFHLGDQLMVDGELMGTSYIKSHYVYQMAKRMPEPDSVMLSADEGKHLLEVAKMVRWSKPASAALLAGWTLLAPICGALRWRPHIWLTGGAGSGKTTIQRDFVAALTSGISIYAQGNSTEAGIRQELRADALPVLLDEAESNDDKERARMDSIIALIRQSSSESQARTLKGTIGGSSMRYNIRSMFCLASVNTNIDKKADVDRLTKLVIKGSNGNDGSADHWAVLSDELHKISTDGTIANRLLSRALFLLPTITSNVEVFCRAAAKFFNSQRDGDQFGTLVAGSWSLSHDTVATDEEAMALLESYDWGEHTEDHDEDDAGKALECVMSSKIRLPGVIGDMTVFELIREMSPLHRHELLPKEDADRTLRQNGIKVDTGLGIILIGTSVSNLKKLVDKTNYATDLRGQLLRIVGASRYDDKTVRFNGSVSKCVSIPLSMILAGEMSNKPPI